MDRLDEKNSYVALFAHVALTWCPRTTLCGAWKTTFSAMLEEKQGMFL